MKKVQVCLVSVPCVRVDLNNVILSLTSLTYEMYRQFRHEPVKGHQRFF